MADLNGLAQHSLALDLFSEIGQITPIYELKREVGFNKANTFIEANQLSLVGRRVVNAALCIAASDPEREDWDIDSDYFKWLIRYTSRNNVPLKDALKEGQETFVEVSYIPTDENGTPGVEQWARAAFFGPVGSRGGRVRFSIPREIRAQLRDPRSFTFLSLRISAALDSIYSNVMYERLSREEYRGQTSMMTVEEFRAWFGKEDNKYLSEFKYLKRNVIDPSVRRINELTDIKVSYETRARGGGKRVTHLVFRVEPNPTGKYALSNMVEIDSTQRAIFESIRKEFNVNKAQMSEILANRDVWDDEYIQSAVVATRYRLAKLLEKGDKIRSPASYLMTVLREGITITKYERESLAGEEVKAVRKLESERAARAARETVDQKSRQTNRLLISNYEILPLDKQNRVFRAFMRSPQYNQMRKVIQKAMPDLTALNVTENSTVASIFVGFLATQEQIIEEDELLPASADQAPPLLDDAE